MNNINENSEIVKYLVNLKLLARGDESEMDKLVEECLNDLKADEIWVKTVKLQVFWLHKYRSKSEVKKFHHETIYKNVLPILMEIIKGSHSKIVDKENLYRKIVIFIIMFAGLGNPTQPTIINETQAALHSIFKKTEMNSFLSLSKEQKEEQLIEFARIVTGIRLFNKDCKKGGEGIEDLPLILTQGAKATKDRFLQFKSKTDKRISHLINVLYHIYGFGETSEKIKFYPEKLEEVKSLLNYFRTIESCQKDEIKDLDDSLLTIDQLVEKFQFVLLQVHEVVRYKVAIATTQVFPLFLQLSDIWEEMQEEVDILSEVNNNFVELLSVAKIPNFSSVEKAFRIIYDLILPPKTGGIVINPGEFQTEIKTCLISAIPLDDGLQYKGFCAWSLAKMGGVLVVGDITLGVLSFQNRFYSFVSVEAARDWAKSPTENITAVLDVVRSKPELIPLLNLAGDLRTSLIKDKESDDQTENPKKTLNASIQTELHPIQTFINKNYVSSEWELRKRALKLANLTRSLTKSQQTIETSFKKIEMGVQMTPVQSKETQTKKCIHCAKYFLSKKI